MGRCVLAQAPSPHGGRRSPGGFAGLARIVTGQQVSTQSADAIWSRFAQLEGALEPAGYLRLFDEAAIRAVGFSAGKHRTVRVVAELAASGALDFAALDAVSAEAAVALLTAHKGIGPWTAEIYLMFCTGHPDIFPVGDLALRKAVGHALGMTDTPNEKELTVLAANWAPYRARRGAAVLALLRGRDAQGDGDGPVTAKLSGPLLPPKSGGQPKQLMVILHGYGADGQDLIWLGYQWRDIFPDMLFVAPNAPDICDSRIPPGYQWFPLSIDRIAGRIEGVPTARPVIVNFLIDLWAQTGLTPANTVLGGFSQGAMMALHVGTRSTSNWPASSPFRAPSFRAEGFDPGQFAKPPVVLIHGESTMGSFSAPEQAGRRMFAANDFDVSLHFSPRAPATGSRRTGSLSRPRSWLASIPAKP